jgi:hypothetical protein
VEGKPMETNAGRKTDDRIALMVRGERFIYHIGNLGFDRTKSFELDHIAAVVWSAYRKGIVTLFQKRVANGFEYYAGRK